MDQQIEKDWTTTAGLRAAVIRTKSAYSRVGGHRCGYVAVPADHPLHGVGYSDETPALSAPPNDEPIGKRGILSVFCAASKGRLNASPEHVFNVHGSITYAAGSESYPIESSGLWWFGFDCAHCDDNEDGGQSLDYVIAECESLAEQIVAKTAAIARATRTEDK